MKFKLSIKLSPDKIHTAGQIASALWQAAKQIAPNPEADVTFAGYEPKSGIIIDPDIGNWKIVKEDE